MKFVYVLFSVIASASEAINRHRIPMILALHTFDYHEAKASRNDNKI